MKLSLKNITLGILLCTTLSNAQDKKEKKAEDKFDNYAYADAIDSYENLIKKGYSSEEIYKNLGNANYLNADYNQAVNWYEKLFLLEGSNQYSDEMYRYAQSLKSQENYTESDKWMQTFETQKSADNRAVKFENKLDYLSRIKKASGRYELNNINVNSKESDYAPAFLGDLLVFSTVRDTGLTKKFINQWDNKPFADLYSAKQTENGTFENAVTFSKTLNTKAHESSAVFTKDEKTVYFTRNNDTRGRFSRDKKGFSRLKLYHATLENNVWTNIKELPFNGDDYSIAHPTLSEDEKTLYFSSDMPGSLGLSDIFSVAINQDGSYGTPQNLGTDINTEARETFPFVHKNILYFASDGHPGLGGLDIFATDLEANESKEVLNIGAPINSEQDDFSYIINDDGKGFFASNREGGNGDDDIYSFKENELLVFECIGGIHGNITDKNTGDILSNTTVTVASKSGEKIFNVQSDADGNFTLEDIPCDEQLYTITATKENYDDNSIEIAIIDNSDKEAIIPLSKIEIVKLKIGDNLIQYLALAPINFDLDKSFIRTDASSILDKVVTYLNENSEVKIIVESHTDVKAPAYYNQKLSEKRAKATFDYLISKGINPSRIKYKGYGENNLANDCTIWEKCTPQKNEQNRRSEIIVTQ